jgi:predicted nucleotidyltransferase component of viral defense system
VNQLYVDAARLLIQVAPVVFESGVFALKGGTAINLFIRDMPRLSVDLDLVFPDHSLPRDEALAQINEAIRHASARLKTRGFQVRATTVTGAGETKLLVRRGNLEIKVEVNFVLRGTVHEVQLASLSAKAQDVLQAELEVPMASLEDIMAASSSRHWIGSIPPTFST